MPVKVIEGLPAIDDLRADNIFVMNDERAKNQNIRPLNLLVVNLMPRKLITERQILRLLSNTPLQINVEFLYMTSHDFKNTKQGHLDSFYKSFSEIKSQYYDGLIVLIQLKQVLLPRLLLLDFWFWCNQNQSIGQILDVDRSLKNAKD